jgi:Tfp pilus assembly protein PilN
MNNILKINFRKRKRLTSLLGLSLDGSKLEGVVLRRTNGSLHVHESFSVALSLDPLTAVPELVGREIRNHLEAAGVRERHCAVCLPLKWVLTATTELPPLPEADTASLLQIEAEKGFHSDVTTLQLADSCCSLAGDKKQVIFAGISKSQIESLIQVLTAAKLKPVSFSLGLTALQLPGSGKDDGTLALAIGETGVGLQITCHGGVAALRGFEGAVASEGSRRVLQAGAVAREARITLGQLPAELRAAIRHIRIFGPNDLARQLADEMELGFEPMGLNVEKITAYRPNEFGVEVPPDAPVSAAFSVAARCLAEQPHVFEFLPPRPTVVEQFVAKYSSGKMRTASLVAAAIVAIVGGLFLVQEIELISLRSQWHAMSAKVADLQALQGKIQRYQPWYDTSFRALTILRQLSLAFPEDGVVTAKSIEIRNGNTVTCSGTASDNGALLRTLSQLRATDGVSSVTVEQIRGASPMQFTFDFQVGNVMGGQP